MGLFRPFHLLCGCDSWGEYLREEVMSRSPSIFCPECCSSPLTFLSLLLPIPNLISMQQLEWPFRNRNHKSGPVILLFKSLQNLNSTWFMKLHRWALAHFSELISVVSWPSPMHSWHTGLTSPLRHAQLLSIIVPWHISNLFSLFFAWWFLLTFQNGA